MEKTIETMDKLYQKHEKIREEISSDVSLLPKEVQDEIDEIKEHFKQQKIDDDKFIEDNKNKKIVGYDNRFMPLYEDILDKNYGKK